MRWPSGSLAGTRATRATCQFYAALALVLVLAGLGLT